MHYELNTDGLVVGADDSRPVAVPIDSFTVATGVGGSDGWVILRLFNKEWASEQVRIPAHRVNQFAFSADLTLELVRILQGCIAQLDGYAEKSSKK